MSKLGKKIGNENVSVYLHLAPNRYRWIIHKLKLSPIIAKE
jgi:hypothetical protein